MWLKLTASDDKTKILINMNNVVGIMTIGDQTILIDVNHQQSHVNESLAEIELMLKGVEPQKANPRSRNVIGRIPDPLDGCDYEPK